MKSVTKAQVTREEIIRLTEQAFAGCDVLEVRELTEGMFNAAYRITGTGSLKDSVILKIGPRDGTKLLTYEKSILRTEVRVYELLSGRDVPVPKVLVKDYSRSLISSDYFFMDYVPGILWKDAEPEKMSRCRDALMEELGRIHREIHSVAGSHFGYAKEDARFRFDSWPKAFAGMMGDICHDGQKDGHVLPYEEIFAIVERHKDALQEVKVPSLVDFDMWAGNVLLGETEDGYRINGIIDFERSFFGDPYADFVSSVMIFDDVEKEDAFRKGYGKPIILDEKALVRMDLYRLYLLVIMYVETYRYEEDYALQTKNWLKAEMDQLMAKL